MRTVAETFVVQSTRSLLVQGRSLAGRSASARFESKVAAGKLLGQEVLLDQPTLKGPVTLRVDALDLSTRGGLGYRANTTGLRGSGSVAPVARQLAEGTSTTRASPCTRTA
jgi:hypothetical protein